MALWLLGFPEAALADADHALKDAREIGQAATLMYALSSRTFTRILCGNYATAKRKPTNSPLWRTKRAPCIWKACGNVGPRLPCCADRQSLGRSSHGRLRITAYRSTGSTSWLPLYLSYLARAHADSANSMTLGAASVKR